MCAEWHLLQTTGLVTAGATQSLSPVRQKQPLPQLAPVYMCQKL